MATPIVYYDNELMHLDSICAAPISAETASWFMQMSIDSDDAFEDADRSSVGALSVFLSYLNLLEVLLEVSQPDSWHSLGS